MSTRVSKIFWHIADVWPSSEPMGTAIFAALDPLLHSSESEDALIVVRSLEDAPLGLTIHQPMFALHVLWTCAAFGVEIRDAAMHRLIDNCYASGGVSAVQPGTPILVRSGLAEPWLNKVKGFLSNCQPDSLAYELFKGIADSAQPVYHSLELPDFADEMDEAEEE